MSSYRQIFKSTALIGATQAANIIIGILRTKALAVLLGPAGMGLAGAYLTVAGFVGGVTGLGLGNSGVRQIAEAAGMDDQAKIAKTILTLRRTSMLSGTLGMIIVLALSVPLSRVTFGNDTHAGALALMSITLLFGGISAGQLAMLQGLRRLRDLAKSQVAGAFFGAIGSVVLVYFLREKGIALFLVANAALVIVFSYWYARKVNVIKVRLNLGETLSEAKGLLSFGVAFVLQNLLLGLGAYLSRVLIISGLGIEAVGVYTATWTLSSYYVNIVLKAMGTDFYPRLTVAANDHEMMNRLVNEQIEMGLLLAVPGVLGVMALSPLVLQLFYSGAFVGGAEIIRWQLIGVVLQVLSWPLGYIQLAKAKGKLFVISEITSASLGLGYLVLALHLWHFEGIGIAAAGASLSYTFYLWYVGRQLSGFRFSRRCCKAVVFSFVTVGFAFVVTRFDQTGLGMLFGLTLAVSSSVVSFRALQKLLGIDAWTLVRSKLGYGYCSS